jgi:hypothetical protein
MATTTKTLVLAGPGANLLERLNAARFTSSGAHASFPLANLVDKQPDSPWIDSAVGAGRVITVNLNHVYDGQMEADNGVGGVTGWTFTPNGVGTGAAATRTTSFSPPEGTRCMDIFTGNTGGATKGGVATTTFQVLRGISGRFRARLQSNGTATIAIRFYDPGRGKYLTSGGTWTTTPTDFLSTSSATWVSSGDVLATIEASPATRYDLDEATILVQVISSTTANINQQIDDVRFFPEWDTAVLAGHNLDVATCEFRTSTDDFAANDVLWNAPTIYKPGFYYSNTTKQSAPYFRVKFPGTNSAPIGVGELVLGQRLALTRKPGFPTVRIREDLIRPLPWRSYALSDDPLREVVLPFDYFGTEWDEARDKVWQRSRNGLHPMVVIPNDADPVVCIYGRIQGDLEYQHTTTAVRKGASLVLQESPFWTLVP